MSVPSGPDGTGTVDVPLTERGKVLVRPGCLVCLHGLSGLEQALGEPGVQLWNPHFNFTYGCKENKAVTEGLNIVQAT